MFYVAIKGTYPTLSEQGQLIKQTLNFTSYGLIALLR